MADSAYRTFPNAFASKGIVARYSDDTLPAGTYLNLDNLEEQTENTLASRLGSILVNRTGTAVLPLPAPVHSLSKLLGLQGAAWRYAGAGTHLYRRSGITQGPYTSIFAAMSGSPWSSAVYRPTMSSYPYLFIADAAAMLKDNGTLVAPQQWGIFAPLTPVQATLQGPSTLVLDSFESSPSLYTKTNFAGATTVGRVSTTLVGAVTSTGNATVAVADASEITSNQLLTVGSGATSEQVLVTAVTTTGFTASFAKTHIASETVQSFFLSGSVSTDTTSSISRAVSLNLSTFAGGTATVADDFIALALNVSDPNNIEQIRVLLDVGDGSFTQDYFYAVIAPSASQASVSETTDATAAAAEALFGNTLAASLAEALSDQDSTTVSPLSPYSLSTGSGVWSEIAVRLGDFNKVGAADINSTTGHSFANVVGLQVQIITNTNGSATVGVADMVLVGGAGPDSFAGVAYDWMYTYYNDQTGAESNPCMEMAEVDAPLNTTHLLPRRAAVQLTLTPSPDSQVTHIRIYRRGGTLASNYLRLDQVPAATTTYIDTRADADIESADVISFINDVPVTSTLPVPVGTALTAALAPPFLVGAVLTVTPAAMTNISVNQQVTLGADTDLNQEIVLVMSVTATTFTAFVQNPHAIGDPVAAEAAYGQPCSLVALAFNQMFFAGDKNNPHFLYFADPYAPERVGSPNYVEVGIPSDPITAIVGTEQALYVATRDRWYVTGPRPGAAPTVYPTSAAHGVVAPFGWVATESEVWNQAVDGIRSFAGGTSSYRSEEIEFIFQGGSTPIALADPANLSQSVMAYHNNIVFLSYVGLDGNRHRLMYHTLQRRLRNDDVPATCFFVEKDTNLLLYGDANGLIHQDRTGSIDEGMGTGNVLANLPIALSLKTAFWDQGSPKNQKNYNEVTLDADTAGQNISVSLSFDDDALVLPLGTLNTTGRQKQNFNIFTGMGYAAYRVALLLSGSVSSKVTFYQADIRAVALAETRKSFDTYLLKFGMDDSKICKQVYLEYDAAATLLCEVFYDGSNQPGFTFTVPASARVSRRVRLPAVKFRLFRMVVTSTADFQIWPDSKFEVKPVCATKGYANFDMVP